MKNIQRNLEIWQEKMEYEQNYFMQQVFLQVTSSTTASPSSTI